MAAHMATGKEVARLVAAVKEREVAVKAMEGSGAPQLAAAAEVACKVAVEMAEGAVAKGMVERGRVAAVGTRVVSEAAVASVGVAKEVVDTALPNRCSRQEDCIRSLGRIARSSSVPLGSCIS